MSRPASRQGRRRASSSRFGEVSQRQRANTPADTNSGIFRNAHNFQINNAIFNEAGGDIHCQHNAGGSGPAIWAVLQAIPNFRKIYQDMLGKATAGTGMWLLKNKKFRIWLKANGDIKIFWGSGMPGAGKTVLASIVIRRLEALRQELEGPTCVCFIYFRYSDCADMTLRRVLEILLKQTLERHPDCRWLIEETYSQHVQEGTEPTESQLVALLRRITDGMAVTFYILDALDEAPSSIQLTVLMTLASLNVKLFITSRPLKAVEDALPEAHTFRIVARDRDIDLHVAKVFNESPCLLNILRQEGPSLREEILSTIKGKSGGMFLHASLQTEALRPCVTLHQVRQTLAGFPSQMEDVYLQTWDRILEDHQEVVVLAKAAFVWVLNASRSMTIQELEQAVATSPETFQFEPARMAPRTTLIELCRGLLVVEEESQAVRLVHYTAKEHLQRLLAESFPHPHALLASVCITHLAECGFQNTTIESKGDFEFTLKDNPLLRYASEAWSFHACQSIEIKAIKERTAAFVADAHAFPAYTSPDHNSVFDIITTLHIVALYRLPLDFIGDFETCDPNVPSMHQQTPLIMASSSGYTSIVELLLAQAQTDVNLVGSGGWSALMVVAQNGHEPIAAKLLDRPEIEINRVEKDGWSALMVAAKNNQERVAALLLACPEIEVNLVIRNGPSALMAAAQYGHNGVAAQLLAHPEIEVNLVNTDGWSALMVAAINGQGHVATLLLAHPEVEVNLVGRIGLSALMSAAGAGHEGVAVHLLAHPKITINLVNKDGWSALMLATEGGHEPVAAHLLARPEIQVNLVNRNGWSALMDAAQYGFEGITSLLLTHSEIQVNLVNNRGGSVLMVACYHGHENIAKVLLAVEDIDINLTDQDGETAMSLALSNGHFGIVQLLQEFELHNSIPSKPSRGIELVSDDDLVHGSDSGSDSSEYFYDAEDWEVA